MGRETYVRNGGQLLLENANVNLGGSSNNFYVENGGLLEMQGGSLLANWGVNINTGGTATLNEVTVKSGVTSSGSLTQNLSTTAKAEGGVDRTLSLTAGTYFIEIAAYDNGAGRYNSTYALELEQETESGTKRFALANA